MKCTLDYDKILAYRLGELTGSEAEEVERHIASCPRCAQEIKAMDGIFKGFTELPRMEPNPARWAELRSAIDHKQRPGLMRLLSTFADNLRRPAAAMAALLLVCALGAYIFIRQASTPAHREIAIEELGSTIAHTHPGERRLSDTLDSYFSDSRALVAAALLCAKSKDVGCWKELTMKITEKDMLYRGIWLSERLSRSSKSTGNEDVRDLALIDDSLGIFRAISKQAPDRLIDTGSALEEKIIKMDLLNRLTEGSGR